MVAPTFRRALDPALDISNVKYAASDIVHGFDILDGDAGTEHIQIKHVEGADRVTAAPRWIIWNNPNLTNTYEAIDTQTGNVKVSSTTPDFLTVLHTLVADAAFLDGHTILIKPSPTPYFYGAVTTEAILKKTLTIYGYGVTLRPGTPSTAALLRPGSQTIRFGEPGKALTIYGLTFDINYPTCQYASAIRGLNDGSGTTGEIDQIHLRDVTIKNIYDMGVNCTISGQISPAVLDQGLYYGKTKVIIENCTFLNAGALNAPGTNTKQNRNEQLDCGSIGSVFIKNTYFQSNKPFLLCARRIHVENVYSDTAGFDNVPSMAIHGEDIYFKNVYVKGLAGFKFRPWSSIHCFTNFGTCKRLYIDGLTVESPGIVPFEINPVNDTTYRMENVTLKNMYLYFSGIEIWPKAIINPIDVDPPTTKRIFHCKIDSLTIENCHLFDIGGNTCLMLIQNTDIDNLILRNISFGEAYPGNTSLIRMKVSKPEEMFEDGVSAGFSSGNVILGNVDVLNVTNIANAAVPQPPTYLITVQDDNSTDGTRIARATFRRCMDNGIGTNSTASLGVRTVPATLTNTTVDVKFKENSGTATIAAGSNHVDITHNLRYTPTTDNIQLTPTNNLGNASTIWVSSTASGIFTVTADATLSGGTATFAWRAYRN